MSFDLERLIYVIMGSVLVFCLALVVSRGWHQRLLLSLILLGLFFYSGIGSTVTGVAPGFSVFYVFFAVAVVTGFAFGRVFSLPVSRDVGRRVPVALPNVDRRKFWSCVIITYFLLYSFPLVWPEFRLHQLLTPSSPDLTRMLFIRMNMETDSLSKLVNYMRLLIGPFFFIALYRYRYRLKWAALIFCLLLYVQYVGNRCYIGRGTVLLYSVVLFLACWILRPRWRTALAIFVISCFPLLLVASYAYARIRIGGTVGHVGLSESVNAVLGVELTLVKRAGMVIYRTGARVNLCEFFTWIVTLPIPKILTGPIQGARINYEISDLVLGNRSASSGGHVVLSSLLSESIYIYGKCFFWLHGFFVGCLAAFYARLMERVPQFLFLFLFVAVLFAFNLNRAGISSLLPILTNQLLLLYLFILTLLLRPVNSAAGCG